MLRFPSAAWLCSASPIVCAAWGSWFLTLTLDAGWVALDRSVGRSHGIAATIIAVVAVEAMATIGLVITRKAPRNAEGWLFCAAPLLMVAGNLAGSYAEYALLSHPGSLPGGRLAGAFGNLWFAGIVLFITFLVLLFPDGRLPGPRWRPVGLVAAVAVAGFMVGTLFAPGPLDQPLNGYDNPLGIDGVQYLGFLGVLVLPVIAAGIVGATVRYRRGGSVERAQLRWFVAAVAVTAALEAGMLVAQAVTGFNQPDFAFPLVVSCVPFAVGIAILRDGLYDIEVIIRRTLVYGALLAVLASLYLGGVALLGLAVRSIAHQGSTLSVTLSTLAVAAAFQPLRSRIQQSVDRRFYRGKYDAAEALAAFSQRARDEIDLDALRAEVLAIAARTLQPARASLWLRDRSSAEHPGDGRTGPIDR